MRRTWLVACAAAVLVGCAGDSAPPEPIHIAYQYRLEDDRDSLSTEVAEGDYEVRVDGDCSAEQLKFTQGGVFDDEFDLEGLVSEGLEVGGDSKWRIHQEEGSEMPDCEGVTLYPDGLDAPAVPTSTTAEAPPTSVATTTTEPSPPTTQRSDADRAEEWADEHLEDLAQTHGSLVGVVNGLGFILDETLLADAVDLCTEAVDAPFLDEASDAIGSYPGGVALEASWRDLLAASNDLFSTCARRFEDFPASLERWQVAELGFGLAVIDVIAEIEGQIDPSSERIAAYDEVREDARSAKEGEITNLALLGQIAGE